MKWNQAVTSFGNSKPVSQTVVPRSPGIGTSQGACEGQIPGRPPRPRGGESLGRGRQRRPCSAQRSGPLPQMPVLELSAHTAGVPLPTAAEHGSRPLLPRKRQRPLTVGCLPRRAPDPWGLRGSCHGSCWHPLPGRRRGGDGGQ